MTCDTTEFGRDQAEANRQNRRNQPDPTCGASVAAIGRSADTVSLFPIVGWILGWWLGRLKRIDYDVIGHLAVNECDPAAGECSGGRWGRIGGGGGAGKIILTRARTHAMEPSRRCPQACDRVASKRLTDLAPFVAHGQHFRTVAIARRPTRLNFEYHGIQICAVVAADRTTTERPNLVYNRRQIRSMVDSYSAARWSLRCFVVIEVTHPI